MRINLAPLLFVLVPLLALAQESLNRTVLSSPLFWYWMVALVVAAAAFAWASIRISRRPPPSRPGTP